MQARPKSELWQPRQVRVVLWIAVVLAVVILLSSHHGLGAHDSKMFRAGATLCGRGLYRYNLQRELVGDYNALFFRAPFYACALRPLLWFNFPMALLVLNLAAVTGFILLLPHSLGKYPCALTPLAALYVPLIYNFSIEQDGALLLLILSVALAGEAAGFPFLAGAILALTLEKPSLFLLLPVVIAVQKKFRMLGGYMAGAAALIGISLWIIGPAGISDYIDLVARYKLTPEKMPTARGLAATLHAFWLWPALSLLAGAAAVWRARRTNFRAAFSIGIAASLFVSPQSYGHDLAVLLLPVLYFLSNGSTFQRFIAALCFVPLVPFLYIFEAPWAGCVAGLVALLVVAMILERGPDGGDLPRAETTQPEIQYASPGTA